MALDPLLAWLDAHYQAMPPVAAMGVRIGGYDGDSLQLRAPLARHVNDKGCAFGGSMASLMTLAGWGLVTLRLHAAGLDADVFVADSSVKFRQPLYADLAVEAWPAGDERWEAAFDALRERGRARMFIAACVRGPDGTVAAEGHARFVALAKG
jgi:thioesterase domain-containing protein